MSAWLAALALQAGGWALPAARPCPPAEAEALLAVSDTPYRLRCQAVLAPGQVVTRPILLEGAESSGAGLDCQGGSIGRRGVRTTTRSPTIAIWSRRMNAPTPLWSRPTDIRIRNCTIHGAVRIWGMGSDGGYEDLRDSSRTADHVARAQAAAPSHIELDRLDLVGTGSIPLYIGPGVTNVRLTRSAVTGRSDAVALYLDAESAENRIEGNRFAVRTGREAVAVDGSARNRLVGNEFNLGGRGGIFLYRNCGERGVIRHQTPSDNLIADNIFRGAARLRPRTVVVGSREGRRPYCGADRGWPYGSSRDDGDNASGNIVERNRIVR